MRCDLCRLTTTEDGYCRWTPAREQLLSKARNRWNKRDDRQLAYYQGLPTASLILHFRHWPSGSRRGRKVQAMLCFTFHNRALGPHQLELDEPGAPDT